MKTFLIILLNVFCFITCFSQRTRINKRDSSIILNPTSVDYKLEVIETNEFKGHLPVEKIAFFDVRYDTSFIAINWQVNTQPKAGVIYKKKITLVGGVASGLSDYFNALYKGKFTDNNCELLCFIKKFSITLKNSLSQNEYMQARSSNVNVELEC